MAAESKKGPLKSWSVLPGLNHTENVDFAVSMPAAAIFLSSSAITLSVISQSFGLEIHIQVWRFDAVLFNRFKLGEFFSFVGQAAIGHELVPREP